MSKKIIVAAMFGLLSTAGFASEPFAAKPANKNMDMPMECTCAIDAARPSHGVRETEKVTTVVVKRPKVQSNIDLHPEDYR